MKQRCVAAQDVVAHVLGIRFGITAEDKKFLRNQESLDKVFIILTDYWSFLDFNLLTSIVNVYGVEDDKAKMKEYQEETEQFCSKFKLSELPGGSLQLHQDSKTQGQGRENITFKVDLSDDRLLTIKELQLKICKILKLEPAMTQLKDIKEGCVEITFLITKEAFDHSLSEPLTKSQCDAFKAESVLSLSSKYFHKIFSVSYNIYYYIYRQFVNIP